jgi:hypothetical protein
LRLTDTLLIGDTSSEARHSYSIVGQTWQWSRTYSFEKRISIQGVLADAVSGVAKEIIS